MNKEEAKIILESKLAEYRAMTYLELVSFIDTEPHTSEITSKNDNWYQIEIQFFWDDKLNNDIRVIGSIDDGGKSVYKPLTSSFIMSPVGAFVGE